MIFRSLFLVPLLALAVLAITACSKDEGCSVSKRPAVPALLSVVQDPGTLVVTATLRDESNNEQWFTLERSWVSRHTLPAAAGTSVENPDRTLPLNKEMGRTVEIEDPGLALDEVFVGSIQSYAVRAWNCYGPSDPSNDIAITALGAE